MALRNSGYFGTYPSPCRIYHVSSHTQVNRYSEQIGVNSLSVSRAQTQIHTSTHQTHTHTHTYIYIQMCVCVCVYFTISPLEQDVTHGQIFQWSLTGLNSEFSFSWTGYHTKVKEPSLPYYLPIAGDTLVGCILFSKSFSVM